MARCSARLLLRLTLFSATAMPLSALAEPLQVKAPAPLEMKQRAKGSDDALVTASTGAPGLRAPAAVSDPGIVEPGLKAGIQQAKAGRANAAQGLRDPIARVLVDWVSLYSNADDLDLKRTLAFLADNPGFPALKRIKEGVEAQLYDNRADAATVLGFFARRPPSTPKGRLAFAEALAPRDGARALQIMREVWRHEPLPREVEARVLERFGGNLTRADHKARMATLLLDDEFASAQRIAARLGAGEVAVARAVEAVAEEGGNAASLLAAVPSATQSDAAFLFAKARFLRKKDRLKEAAQVMLSAPRDVATLGDADEWAVERRILARRLLDEGDARLAYRIVALHAAQDVAERVEAEFFAGFIALRSLNDAASAIRHFETARSVARTPMSQTRALYWLGRAHKAAGNASPARAAFGQAARHSAFYYGQLARAEIGETAMAARRPARPEGFIKGPSARAVKMLYAIGERQLAHVLLADLGARLGDPAQIDAIGEIASKAGDTRGVLTLGKQANNRGLPFDVYAFPTMGIPSFAQVGPQIDKAVVYAIARQESTFDPKAVSGAGAKGLLQLLPSTARQTARAYGVAYNPDRLTTDAAYNAKLGAAHLGQLASEYRGSYILTFAAYNAGGGKVKDWIEAYGDPRTGTVDPVDWVERIPYGETRNYVQRVMENVQVYRARLGGDGQLRIMADMKRGRS